MLPVSCAIPREKVLNSKSARSVPRTDELTYSHDLHRKRLISWLMQDRDRDRRCKIWRIWRSLVQITARYSTGKSLASFVNSSQIGLEDFWNDACYWWPFNSQIQFLRRSSLRATAAGHNLAVNLLHSLVAWIVSILRFVHARANAFRLKNLLASRAPCLTSLLPSTLAARFEL